MLNSTTSVVALAGVMVLSASPALAETAERAVTADDIIVTAQRRNESLARTPVSVAVLTPEIIAKLNITTEADLQFAAPGLTVRVGATSNEITFAIRGQSVDQFSGTRPGVLPYFNDVQISANTGGGGATTSFYDLQSIQVLKGPQGTLFGRNATGGAVLFTTSKPTAEFGGYVSARLGNYSTEQFEGAINVPLAGETLMSRVAGFYADQDGFQNNRFNNTRLGTLERYGLRGSLTYQGDTIRNELVVDYYHASGTNATSVLYAIDPGIGFVPTPFLYSPNADLVLGPGAWAAYLAANPNPTIPAGGLVDYLEIQQANGPFNTAVNGTNFFTADNIMVTNATIFELGDSTELKNIAGYARLEGSVAGDSDGSPFGIAGADPDPNRGQPGGFTRTEIFSNELQVLGKAAESQLDYVAGLFFSKENSYTRRESTFLDLFGGPITTNEFEGTNTTLAAFGQGTYDLNAADGEYGFAITAGLRFTSEKVHQEVLPDDVAFPTPGQIASGEYANPQSRTFQNLSWTIGLQNQLDAQTLLYAKSRRSYRNGGFNGNQAPRVGGAETQGNSFETETVTDIEFGAKHQGMLGTIPTRLNLALYHTWIENSQRNAFAFIAGNPSSLVVNVPRSTVYGVELDGQFNLTDWLNVGGNLNYTKAKFTDGEANVNGTVTEFATVPDTPEWSGGLYADVSAPISQNLRASLRGDMYAQSSVWYISTGNLNPTAQLPGYSVVNFRAGISDDDAGWSISANLKNAFDEVYYVGGIAIGQLLGYNTAVPGAPRTISVEARFRF